MSIEGKRLALALGSIEGRRLALALGLSVLVNLFLAGVLTGRFAFGPDSRAGGHGRPVVRGALIRTLPEDERKRFGTVMQAHKDEIARRHAAVSQAKTVAETDIAAPVFDRARIEADFAAIRRATAADQEAVQTAYLEALGVLSPSARAALIPRQTGTR